MDSTARPNRPPEPPALEVANPDDHIDDHSRLPELIRAMLQPGFYPHPVEEPIAVVQTHAAYVVLTGPYAYKIKKPVSLGFLDFSTLERRRHYCDEELRLNRRITPQLYRAVLPICRPAGGYAFGAAPAAVEYALQMRQFPQGCLLGAMLERGELTAELAGELGQQVARLHRSAPTGPEIERFGSLQAVERVIAENYRSTEGYVGRDLSAATFAEIRAYTDAVLERHADWLGERQSAGMIRECHGDLHLSNACRFEGAIRLFDCTEFNPAFRNIDVMYDAAFMLMDLQVRGRTDLAFEYLNTYLEHTGDYRGVRLLPLYVSMRAYIRAKVASLLSDDPHLGDERRAAMRRQAATYYRHAWAATRPRPPRLIAMMGLSGSGKSTIGRHLARRDGAILIRSDVIRKHLCGLPMDQEAPDQAYDPVMGRACYARMIELGVLLAGQGRTVILDAKYDRRSQRGLLIEQARAAGIPLRLIHCDAPLSVLQDRVARRVADASDATVAVLLRQRFEALTPDERAIAAVLDTTSDPDALLASVPPQ
ncbi:MAG TPA: AAA family ATPase [Herpetosiphonaceae bacterium]|nr:AAA family ATPase [Herpetosiphonaceae bacterium]